MNRAFSWFCKIFIKPSFNFFFIKEIRGLENVPKGNFILASNHQSHLDWIVDCYLCAPKRFTFIGQVDRYKGSLGFARDFLYFVSGVIRLDRESDESKKKATKQAIKILKKGDILIVYPEGTRSRTGEIAKAKWGVAKIFLASGIPILPVGIKGTFELLPPGGKLKIKKTIKINVGKPLYFKEESERVKNIAQDSEEYKQILIRITDDMMQKILSLKSALS